MSKSVRSQISANHPGITETTIRQASRSKNKNTFVWIVAEGDDDAELYGRMYDDSFVKALPSTIKKGNNSCLNVERIVANVLRDTSIKIIGIRDKDYTPFTEYRRPQNIFLTDQRDIEMQIIHCNWNRIDPYVALSVKSNIIEYSMQVGLYRIFNDREKLCFCFDSLNVCGYWDFSHKQLRPGWQTQLEGFFFYGIESRLNVALLKQMYSTFVNRLNGTNLNYCDICQGHEFVSLLKGLGSNALKKLDKELFKWYSKSDYNSTQLAREVRAWAVQNNCPM